jgi:heme/copper-type cytochrome/quinol oxidase subunit 1
MILIPPSRSHHLSRLSKYKSFRSIGNGLAFMPLYVLGFLGMTRRMQHYDVPEWHPWTLVAAGGPR